MVFNGFIVLGRRAFHQLNIIQSLYDLRPITSFVRYSVQRIYPNSWNRAFSFRFVLVFEVALRETADELLETVQPGSFQFKKTQASSGGGDNRILQAKL